MRCHSPAHLRRHLAATLDLTLWCLGCDVRHPAGNLLVRRGFGRVRPPPGRAAATMYTGPALDAVQFAVWGFGLFLGDPDGGVGLLLRRHDEAGARLTAVGVLAAPLWTPDALPAGRAVTSAADAALLVPLLRAAAARVDAHERWVAAECGLAYRPACAASQPRHVRRRQRLGTAELVSAWKTVADGYAAYGPALAADAADLHARPAAGTSLCCSASKFSRPGAFQWARWYTPRIASTNRPSVAVCLATSVPWRWPALARRR